MPDCRLVKTYTESCGCECEDWEISRNTTYCFGIEHEIEYTKRCVNHALEYENLQRERKEADIKKDIEYEALRLQRIEDEIKAEQLKTYNLISLTKHLRLLKNIEHQTYTPIKQAVVKYKEYVINSSYGTRWIQNHIAKFYKDLLIVVKIKNKWMCSKERLDLIDFNIISKHETHIINEPEIQTIKQTSNYTKSTIINFPLEIEQYYSGGVITKCGVNIDLFINVPHDILKTYKLLCCNIAGDNDDYYYCIRNPKITNGSIIINLMEEQLNIF